MSDTVWFLRVGKATPFKDYQSFNSLLIVVANFATTKRQLHYALSGNPDASSSSLLMQLISFLYGTAARIDDTFEYFTDVLNRLAYISPNAPDDLYRELLPDRWAKK